MDFDKEKRFSSNPNDFPPGVLPSIGSFQGVSGNSPLITAGQVVCDNTLAQQYLNQPGVREKYDKFVNDERALKDVAPVNLKNIAFEQRVLGKQSRAAYPYVAALPQASAAAPIAAATTSIYQPINNIQGTQFSGLGNPSALQGANYGELESMDPDSDSDLDIDALERGYNTEMTEGGKGKRKRKRRSTKKRSKKRKSKKRRRSTKKRK